MGNPEFSVLIPTYKRGHLLSYVFEGLRNQEHSDFEVVVVLKPSGDGTEDLVEKYQKFLDINLVRQDEGYVVDALNLGLECANGDIIAFLDDDAIPLPGWIQNHVESYAQSNVGGVAGNVIPAMLNGESSIPIGDNVSDIIPNKRPFLSSIGRKVWSRPLEGLEDSLVYVSKAGLVEYNFDLAHLSWHQTTKSLLGMGANMSVSSEAVKDFKFPNSWILGLAWEQFLGWSIWKKGYTLVFNPNATVHHLVHGQTLTRNVTEKRREMLRCVENNLLFYRLQGLEHDVSWMHRIAWIAFSTLLNLKKLCTDKELQSIIKMKSVLYSELIGIKWTLSKALGGGYTPLTDLERLKCPS